jgi:hypothetical protein
VRAGRAAGLPRAASLSWRAAGGRATLSPVGRNSLCYRIFEAAASGSTPVVEDAVEPAACRRDPLAQLKAGGAPFVWVRNWTAELPGVLAALAAEPPPQRARRRAHLRAWYADYLHRMQTRFLRVLAEAFEL